MITTIARKETKMENEPTGKTIIRSLYHDRGTAIVVTGWRVLSEIGHNRAIGHGRSSLTIEQSVGRHWKPTNLCFQRLLTYTTAIIIAVSKLIKKILFICLVEWSIMILILSSPSNSIRWSAVGPACHRLRFHYNM